MRKRAIEAKANITEDCLRSIKLVLERTLMENESLRKKLEAVTIENNDLRSEINARINQRKYDYSRCSDCPCFDLINRQQTEIESLNAEHNQYIEDQPYVWANVARELAKRIKSKFWIKSRCYSAKDIIEIVDKVLVEMVGDTE